MYKHSPKISDRSAREHGAQKCAKNCELEENAYKRVITVPITVYEGIRGDPRASQNFRLFKIFLSHEKKTLSIGDEKLPYFGENQMKSTNLFFYKYSTPFN